MVNHGIKSEYCVLIIDYMGYDSASEIPYLFKQAGCQVDVFCTPQSWLLKNSYYDNYVLYKNKNPESFVHDLKKVLNKHKYDWVLTVDDVSLDIINSQLGQNPILRCVVPLSKMENRIMLGSKAGLSILCKKYKLLTPDFVIYGELEDDRQFIDNVKDQLLFPVLLKVDKSAGGVGIFVCRDLQVLVSNLRFLSHNQKRFLVAQNYISGESISVESIFCNGKLLAYTYSRATKTFRGEFGISAVREYSQAREIESVLSIIGKDLGVNGFANMTFVLEHITQKYFFIEADLRTNAWLRLAVFVGVDFSLAIKSFLSRDNVLIRPNIQTQSKKLSISYFSRDIALSVLDRDIVNLFKWIFNFDHRWRYLPWYDFRLLLAIPVDWVRLALRKVYVNLIVFPFMK